MVHTTYLHIFTNIKNVIYISRSELFFEIYFIVISSKFKYKSYLLNYNFKADWQLTRFYGLAPKHMSIAFSNTYLDELPIVKIFDFAKS